MSSTPATVKPRKFGPRAMKILEHLVLHPCSTQRELLDLIRPEHVLVPDWRAALEEEKRLGRNLTGPEYDAFRTLRQEPSKRWGCSYFLPTYPGTWGSDYRASLVLRGVIAVSPVKRGRSKTYVITPLGMHVLANGGSA